jgi:L-malate glycosyltransferase
MKVAYLLGSLNRGGTETLLLDIMANAGSAPFLIIGLYRKEGDLSKVFKSTGVRIIKISPGSLWLLWFYIWRLHKLFRQEKIEIVHAHQRIDAIFAGIACWGLPAKVVQTFHSLDFSSGKWFKLLIRISLKFTRLNIFVSEIQKWFYEKKYKSVGSSNQAIVYNGIDFHKLNSHQNNYLRNELKINNDTLLLGMVGNFVPGRDPLTICRFLKLLDQNQDKFIFLFIGKKDEKNPGIFDGCVSYCQSNGLSDKVIFMGSRNDVPSILPQLDAFLYSSNHDTFGIAVIEAIAAGIPVFVNDWRVMVEITENGKFATLYETKNENDLFTKFESYLSNKKNIMEQAKLNALKVQEKYNIQNHLNRLHEVYKSLI